MTLLRIAFLFGPFRLSAHLFAQCCGYQGENPPGSRTLKLSDSVCATVKPAPQGVLCSEQAHRDDQMSVNVTPE
jgi:hypothetical protein